MQRKPRMKATVEKSSARSAWGRMVAVVCYGLGGWKREVCSVGQYYQKVWNSERHGRTEAAAL
jgi:hypothetical protein